jgi:hypothetical protein
MPQGGRRVHRPVWNGPNWDSPQLRGLLWWWVATPVGMVNPLRGGERPTSIQTGGFKVPNVKHGSLGYNYTGVNSGTKSVGCTYSTISDGSLGTMDRTLTVHIAINYVPTGSGHGGAILFGIGEPSTYHGYGYDISETSGASFCSTGAWSRVPASGSDYWLTGTLDGTNRRCYQNGKVLSNISGTYTAYTDTITQVSIGDCYVNGNWYGWNGNTGAGLIHYDCRVYDRALTESEAIALYDPATRWDAHWIPSTRTYFHIPSTPSTARAGVVTRQQGARSVPTGPYQFNQDSPQANGLFYWLGGVGVRSHNHSWPVPWTDSDFHDPWGLRRVVNPFTGFGIRSPSNDAGFPLGTIASMLIMKRLVHDFTVVIRHRMESYYNTLGSIIAADAWTLGSDDSNYEIGGVATTNKMYFRYRTGSSTSSSVTCSTLTFADASDEKKIITYVVTRSGATVRFYKNSAANYEELTLGTNVDFAWKGSAPNGTSISYRQQASIADFRMYDRALSESEVGVVMDPQVGWDLFLAPTSRVYFDIPATNTNRVGRIMTMTTPLVRPTW